MGNLTKKTITRGAVVALALSAGAATTANAAVTRVSGADRYATSTQVLNAWPTTPTAAILAAGVGHEVDALTVAPLAKQKNAPIVLVDTTATTATIVAQFANFSTVYIANGTGVISPAVETALTAAGKTVVRLGGATRYETALKIAKAFGAANNIVVANGDNAHLVDSLSIASIAAAKGMPIFLSTSTSMDPAEATYAKGLGATNAYVLGGPTLVSDATVTGLGTATRLAGAGRYETNAAVVTAFKADTALDLSNVYVASGEDVNLIDSLVAAPLAGLKKAPIVFAHDGLNADVNTLLKGVINKDTSVTVLGGTGAVTADTMGAIMNIQVPGSYVPTATNTGALAVSSVTATGAKSIKVTFNQAPADTSKVVFTVQNASVPVTVTATWNAANTEAVLTSAANFAEGSYTVNVKNNTTDLGTSTVAIAQQKIAKITITSTKLGVASQPSGKTTTYGGFGYASYKVFDQFGNDITLDPMANSLTFQSGVGSVTGKNGVIKVSPTVNLITFTSGVVITAYDSSSGVSTSQTLTVSTQLGTLSDINISALTNTDSKVLTAQDTASLFYLTYTATDISGNPTTDYDTVYNGLILDQATGALTGTSSYITAKVVHDPSDSNKAAIQVQVNSSNDSISTDMPIVITAMTYTGKTSTLNVTLKKAAVLDKITLMAPAYNIAVNEDKEIPFTAVDQNGATLTKFEDVALPSVSLSGAHWYRNADGTASLRAGADANGFGTDGQQMITATTSTGKYSNISLNIQKRVVADSLNLGSFNTIFQETATTTTGGAIAGAATQNVDFGYDAAGMSIKDQYGRVIDMTTSCSKVDGSGNPSGNNRYYVTAESTDNSVVYVDNTAKSGTGKFKADGVTEQHIQLVAKNRGTATITFKLYSTDPKNSDGSTRTSVSDPIDTKTQTVSVLKNDDIKDYTIDTIANPIYVDASTTGGAITVAGSQSDYKFNPTVYGLTATKAKVVLAGTPILGMNVDSGDFLAYADDFKTNTTGPFAPGKTDVVARKFADTTKTGSSTNLTVTLLGADGNVHTVSTPVKSTTADPVAKSIQLSVSNKLAGISVDKDVVTLTKGTGTYSALIGTSLAKYFAGTGTALDGTATTQNVYIGATDQYGQDSEKLAQFVRVDGTTAAPKSHGTVTIDQYGNLSHLDDAVAGTDYVTITGVTTNGLVYTFKIIFN